MTRAFRHKDSGRTLVAREGTRLERLLEADKGWAEFEPEPEEVPETEPAEKPLEKYTTAELKAHAAEHGIDLGEATKKPDILAAILAAGTPAETSPVGDPAPPAAAQD